MNANQTNFRSWIEAGFKHYGKDPWFFIRELAQNSRDAGAHSIKVRIGFTTAKEEALTFEDDGCGMSYAHAKNFLFRLYASSKTGDKNSAGMFGIGFWTVLKFNPSRIIIESQWEKGKQKEKWGVMVEVGADLKTKTVPCQLRGTGTRITLIRNPQEPIEKDFYNKTHQALLRYCSYLRRNNRNSDPLPVLFDGKTISSDMHLPGPVSLRFKEGAVEGAVGLGPHPQVRLYVRGLPVWEGTSLEELSHIPPEKPLSNDFGQGLAPVFLLNGNRLEVNISRQKVIDNRHLHKVRQTAERALARMVENAVDYVSPRTTSRRYIDKIKGSSAALFGLFGKTFLLILLLLVTLEIVLIKSFYQPPQTTEIASLSTLMRTISLRADGSQYNGASVGMGRLEEETGFSYTPKNNHWFTLFYADHYNQETGFIQTKLPITSPEPTPLQEVMGISTPTLTWDCNSQKIQVNLNIQEKGKIFLLQPLFFWIDASTITLNGLRLPPENFERSSIGEAVLRLPHKGTIQYQCCPLQNSPPLTRHLQQQWLALPAGFKLPVSLEQRVTQKLAGDIKKKVTSAVQLTTNICQYDASPATAQQYANPIESHNWFRRVRQIGAGDCDILNGINVLFLRKMGVPARLVIGAVGRNGKILPILHAWTEYYDTNGFRHMIDASTYASRLTNGSNKTITNSNHQANQRPLTPDFNNREEATGKNEDENRNIIIIYILGSLIVVLITVLGVLLAKEIKKQSPLSAEVRKEVEKSLAGMALHALVHPHQGIWGAAAGIMDFPIIPTCKGRPISIRKALKLGQVQRLFTASKENPLMSHLLTARGLFSVPILDASNEAFAPLLKLLPGAIHLDQVAALKVIYSDKAKASAVGKLVTAVNQLLKKIGGSTMPPCMLAAGIMRDDFFDADLSPLPKLPQKIMPNRFVAVNPSSKKIIPLASLFSTNAILAQYRFIQLLINESRLIPGSSSTLMEKVASHLLLRPHGEK